MKLKLAVGIGAVALVATSAMPASAGDEVVADNLVSPLGFAVGDDGTLYVAEAFAGLLTKIETDGTRTELASAPPGSGTAGVALSPKGHAFYTLTLPPEVGTPPETALAVAYRNGGHKRLASLSDYEAANNPDAGNEYGIIKDGKCYNRLTRYEKQIGMPVRYKGQIESNPYAVAWQSPSNLLVADAAGNDILRVRNGRVSTVAVLPPIAQELDKPTVRQVMRQINRKLENKGKDPLPKNYFDSCIGEKYASNPVPTDVEIGPDGNLYVSTLPGFPELPGYARIFKVDPSTGAYSTAAKGLTGATDLAVAHDGTMYVTELFAYQVSTINPGDKTASSSTFVECPTAVEIGHGGDVYVAHNGVCDDTPGEIMKLAP